ncbi:MAG: hypothetical protein HQ521_06615 [Bacteroidetes bacterium]|nr:hypothetical protein [Bacteroidota bacterium]
MSKQYYPFGMQMDERTITNTVEGYRFGFNGQEGDDEVAGKGNSYTATFWQFDSRLGRKWNMDPRQQYPVSPYACFSNSPIYIIDRLGDTTYYFNKSGQYSGMSDVNISGIRGSLGEYKTFSDANGDEFEGWVTDKSFRFNDSPVDRDRLDNMEIGEIGLQVISDENINHLMTRAGIKKKNPISRFFYAKNESSGGRMDFGLRDLGGSSGGGSSDTETGGFFLFSDNSTAYNAMDAGNYLWGQSMKRLCFDYSSAQFGSQFNEWFSDPPADQRAIKSGFFHQVATSKEKIFNLTIHARP